MPRSWHLLESVERLLESAQVDQGPSEVRPVARGVIGVELHRLADPAFGFFEPTDKRQDLTHRAHRAVVVGVEEQRTLLMPEGLRQVPAGQEDLRQDTVALAFVLVQFQAAFRRGLATVYKPGLFVQLEAHRLPEAAGEPGVRHREVRVALDGAVEQIDAGPAILRRVTVVMVLAAQVQVIGFKQTCRSPTSVRQTSGLDLSDQGRHDGRGNLVLNREQVFEVAVEAAAPQLGTREGVE